LQQIYRRVDPRTWRISRRSRPSLTRNVAVAESHADHGWETRQRERRLAWLQPTPLQRLRWLEQAKEFARRAHEAARRRRDSQAR
jgi:hypothetical protein